MQVKTNQYRDIKFDEYPDECPFCHKAITPNPIYGYHNDSGLEILMACPDNKCKLSFVAYYHNDNGSSYAHYQNFTSSGTIIEKEFSENILSVSPSFRLIYNQAYHAEQSKLTEICGVGYRKALEFLIKDYIIFNNKNEEEKIKRLFLGNVIDLYVNDVKIKNVSKRAVWLGNDETHYVRKWETKDLTDLKNLITLTLHWIEMEILTQKIVEEMPD